MALSAERRATIINMLSFQFMAMTMLMNDINNLRWGPDYKPEGNLSDLRKRMAKCIDRAMTLAEELIAAEEESGRGEKAAYWMEILGLMRQIENDSLSGREFAAMTANNGKVIIN